MDLRRTRKAACAAIAAITMGAGLTTVRAAEAAAPILTPAVVDGDVSLSGPTVRGVGVSPDGALVTFLKGRPDNSRQLDLWSLDVATGAERMLVSSTELVKAPGALSEEEKNRRERQRIYDSGIVDYQWDKLGKQILVPLGGDVYVYDLAKKAPQQLTATDAFETDARFSPDGHFVSFIRNDEVFAVDLASGRETQVTHGANGVIRNGVSEFVAQEELDRDTGYWWSPNEQRIAFTQIDESPVPVVTRLDISGDKSVTISERYPSAGSANVKIRLAVARLGRAKPVWIDLGANPDIYVARAYWSKDSAKLYVVRLARDQKTLDFLEANPATGVTRILFTEQSKTWINLNDGFRPLDDGGFLWTSEDTGFAQIYRYDAAGHRVGAVTQGPGLVASTDCVNETAGLVYYGGWRTNPLERHLFAAPLAGGEARQISTQAGQNAASYSDNCKTAIHAFSSDNQPPQVGVYSAEGEFRFWLNENKIAGDHPYAPYLASHLAWTYGQITAADGNTSLDYKYLKPEGLKPGERRPAIVLVYGGPHAQTVLNSWDGGFAQMLADNGFVVFRLDNRGASNRGTAFENSLYRDMGDGEVQDQAKGAAFLASLPFVDAKRIGVFGWSYGGYMTLRMLTATPDLYASGAAGAPVTDWALYDSAYTERYMGRPQNETAAYARGSVFSDLPQLKAHLLLLHGMADDNVVFQNSVRLMAALQKQGTAFELMTYPGEKHGFRQTSNRIHRDTMILDFFNRTLKTKPATAAK